jgi:hypothetical protein
VYDKQTIKFMGKPSELIKNDPVVKDPDEDPAGGMGDASTHDTHDTHNPDASKGEHDDLIHLDPKEQRNPVAWKWAVWELRHLRDIENKYLTLKDDYAQLDKNYAVHKAQAQKGLAYDIISSAFLTIGPVLIGLTPSFSGADSSFLKWTILVIGILMFIAAVIVKIISYKD